MELEETEAGSGTVYRLFGCEGVDDGSGSGKLLLGVGCEEAVPAVEVVASCGCCCCCCWRFRSEAGNTCVTQPTWRRGAPCAISSAAAKCERGEPWAWAPPVPGSEECRGWGARTAATSDVGSERTAAAAGEGE